MTLEKSSNWWDTPGLGELSMAAGSIPTGVGTYAAGRELLNLNPRVAASAGALVGGAQAVNNILQARENGRSGVVTPANPISDVGKSLLTGGMGVLAGAGLGTIANTGPMSPRNMAVIGGLVSLADYARRRGRAALERRAYDGELNRQMEDYYSKEAQVAWYGHPRLRGSLLNTKMSLAVSNAEQAALRGQEAVERAAAAPAPSAPATPPPPSAMQMAAARAAGNAMASGMAGVAAGAVGSAASSVAGSAQPAPPPARQRPRPQNRPAAARPAPTPSPAAASPATGAAGASAGAAAAGAAGAGAAAPAGGGFGGALQRMIQAAQSTPPGAAEKPIFTGKPQAGAPMSEGGQDPKITAYLMDKKKGLMAGGGQDPKVTAYLTNKKKELMAGAGGGQDPKITEYLRGKDKGPLAGAGGSQNPMKDESIRRYKPNAEGSAPAPSLASLLTSPDGQIRLPAGLTGSLTSGANMVSTGAGAVGGAARNLMQSATNPLRNIPNFF